MKPLPIRALIVLLPLLAFAGAMVAPLKAQVGIGTTNPHPSAMLHVTTGPGQNKGILLPGISSGNLSALDSSQNIANGLIVFDEDLQKHYYFNNSPQLWKELDHDWVREDVHGASASIGQNISLGVNGNVGIGTTSANAKVSVAGNMEIGSKSWVDDSLAPANSLIVQNWIGIGTARQGSGIRLDVNGNARVHGNLYVENEAIADKFTGEGVVPRFGIIMYSGPMSNFDANGSGTGDYRGWQLCNGLGGSPDLRGRFVAARSGFGPSSTTNTQWNVSYYNNTGNRGGQDSVALTIAQLPAHAHGGSTGSVGNHQHVTFRNGTTDNAGSGNVADTDIADGGSGAYVEAGTNFNGSIESRSEPAGSHSHTIPTQGSGEKHDNRPPYYVLAFMMKL